MTSVWPFRSGHCRPVVMREGESRVAGQQSRRGKEKYDVFGEEGIPVEAGGRGCFGGRTVGALGGGR